MKILIAEDERVTRRSLQRQLESWGHSVFAAADGGEAWEELQRRQFDIVVTDWEMPRMDGRELIQRIRRSNPSSYTYLIMLTGRSETADLVTGMEAGADDFLAKPFDRGELQVRLRAGERIIELERSLAERNQMLLQANERMKRDLEAAARVQQSLLPTSLPEVPRAKFAWDFRPCDELAGDLLNVFQLDEEHIGMYVADVSGHGVAASLLSVTISRVLTPQASMSSLLVKPDPGPSGQRVVPPAEVARELNRRFPMEESGEKYFTIAYGILNTETREFRYVSAGHPPIVRFSSQEEAELLNAPGTAIGWFPEADWEEHILRLDAGDRLYIYSDGVPEAMNAESVQFGEQRLVRTLAGGSSQDLDNRLTVLVHELEEWCGTEGPRDDVSVLALEVQ